MKTELERQHDDLLDYVNDFDKLFVDPLEEEQKYVEVIINHLDFDKWGIGLDNAADPFVVALAKEHDLAVVTYENPRATKNRIPAACRFLDVRVFNFVEFLRNSRFNLEG